jgi:POT family proton-dependent oligopeptide transporter
MSSIPPQTGFLGHPKGLQTLFFTEMWERFSYYGMRALLVLFMTAPVSAGGLGFNVARAGAIYGLYTAFVYLLALPGGWIADRIIGQRKAVLYGGMIIAAGHFSMAVNSTGTFYTGLLLIVLGTGLLKPNISTMVGDLYPQSEGARRDAGFSIFYMGINLGAFFSPLVCGYLGEKVNWHLGFAAAGIGMVAGLIQYVLGGKYLGTAGLEPHSSGPEDLARQKRNLLIGVVGILALVAAVTFGLHLGIDQIAAATGYMIAAIGLGYLAYVIAFGGLTGVERGRVVVIGVLFLSAAIFWAGFEQAGSSLNLVAAQLTNLDLGGLHLTASSLQSINPLFIIVFAPVAGMLWIALSRRGLEPSSTLKFGLGLVLLGAGFVVMIFATALAASGVKISPMWLVLTYFLHTAGELSLSPVGLSTVTKLAPHRMVGQMMGIWFMAASLGNLVAGVLAGSIGAGEGAGGEISASAAREVFIVVAVMSIGAGVLLAALSPLTRRLTGGVK